jgi:hypothetical protein
MTRHNVYAQTYRLRFIDYLLARFGRVNRADLTDYFGLSIQQVSLDLRAYDELAPGNMIYDKTLKAYRPTDAFKRVFP